MARWLLYPIDMSRARTRFLVWALIGLGAAPAAAAKPSWWPGESARRARQAEIKARVLENVAASKASRQASRFGKVQNLRRPKPFRQEGPDSVLRTGYTLQTNLKVDRYGYGGWDTAKTALHLDLESAPIKRFRTAASKLQGKPAAEIVKELDHLIAYRSDRPGRGVWSQMLALRRIGSTSERPAWTSLGEFVRRGQASNLEALVLAQVGLQAAGVPAKLVAGEAKWGSHDKVPMWIEIRHGDRPLYVAAEYGYVKLVDDRVTAVPDAQHGFTLTRP